MRRALAALLTWCVQRCCGWLGHDLSLERDAGRLGVVCESCGWRSVGIGIECKRKAA